MLVQRNNRGSLFYHLARNTRGTLFCHLAGNTRETRFCHSYLGGIPGDPKPCMGRIPGDPCPRRCTRPCPGRWSLATHVRVAVRG